MNAANASLQLGDGVAGTIRRKGSPIIQEVSNKIGGTHIFVFITIGRDLKAKYIIQAVGSIRSEEYDDEKLKNATLKLLNPF